jgi:hypothetical protein
MHSKQAAVAKKLGRTEAATISRMGKLRSRQAAAQPLSSLRRLGPREAARAGQDLIGNGPAVERGLFAAWQDTVERRTLK